MLGLIKKYKYFIPVVLIMYAILLFPLIKSTTFVVMLPGGLEEVNDLIEIKNPYKQKGTINSTYIISYRKSTIFQKFLCSKLDMATMYDEKDTGTTYISNIDYSKQATLSNDSSVIMSIIKGYEQAGKYIDYEYKGIYVNLISEETKNMLIGDILLGSSKEEAINKYIDAKNNHTGLEILRNNKLITVYPEETDIVYPYYDYIVINDSDPKYKINNTNTGGPSGGLLQTLYVFNALTEFDYTYGLKIAGTGTIEYDNSIGGIGGIEQKIYTAHYNSVDIYFVPEDNYEDALNTYNKIINPKMKLVKVTTLEDAINYLKEYKN